MSIIRDSTIRAQKYLKDDEILLFVGARQAGKTTILRQLEEVVRHELTLPSHFLNLEDPEYRALLNTSPKNLFKIFTIDLERPSVMFMDEVQYLNDPSNVLKYLYDEYKGRLKIIASGSSAFYLDQKFKDSLAGRKRIFTVFTLSFTEFLRFKGVENLRGKIGARSLHGREQVRRLYEEYLLFGGYPRVVLAPLDEKRELLKELTYSYVKKDLYEAKVRREEHFYKLMKILSSQTGQLVNSSELAGTLGVSKTAIQHYLFVMQKSFHIMLVPPFFKNMRKELTKMPKVFFLDLGLRNFLIDRFETFAVRDDRGPLLENAAFRQLLEGYGSEQIRFWRTTQEHEVDFVVGERQAFEIKADVRGWRSRSVKAFQVQYSAIPVSLVTFDSQDSAVDGVPVINVWDLGAQQA